MVDRFHRREWNHRENESSRKSTFEERKHDERNHQKIELGSIKTVNRKSDGKQTTCESISKNFKINMNFHAWTICEEQVLMTFPVRAAHFGTISAY